MKSIAKLTLSILVISYGLVSCKLTSEAVTSSVEVPETYNDKTDTVNIGVLPWSVLYEDSLLLTFVSTALEHNKDLNISVNELALAATQFGMVRRNNLPSVKAELNNRHAKFGEYTMDGVGNDDTNRSEGVSDDKKIPTPYREWFAGFVFSWEADLWGKLSSQRKAALARYLASAEANHLLQTEIVSDVAINYYSLIGLNREKEVIEQNVKLQELGLELVKIQKLGGKVNQLAVDQFEAQVLNTKARLVAVDQRILQTKARLNFLMGEFPSDIKGDSLIRFDTINLPKVGKPDELLQNRPDIRAAELALSASHFDLKSARAAFYPSLTIGGKAGFSAFDISRWFVMPGSAAYDVASGLSAPLFQRKQIQRLYEAARVKQRLALTEYEKVLLTAFHEVYVTVSNFNNLSRQIDLKRSEAEVLRRAFNNSSDLFSVGYASYLEVVTAQRRMLDVELELIQLQTEKLKTRAILYRALGGGWRN